MPDDIDDLLRSTMKTLDEQVPSGYFEALPERTLARLASGEQADMQQQGTIGSSIPSMSAPPLAAAPGDLPARDDDSGLHDIRNLAQSTKQRLSSRRSSTHPPIGDENVLASSSAAFANLALPQPAKMVSLPELSELPSKQDVIAKDKAAKKQAAETTATLEAKAAAAPGVAAPVESQAFAAFADRAKKSTSTRTIALVGMGLAAAAGAVLFVATRSNDDHAAAVSVPTGSVARNGNDLAEKTKDLDRARAELEAKHEALAAAPVVDTATTAGTAPAAADPAPDKAPAAKPMPTKHAALKKTTESKPETTTVTAVDDAPAPPPPKVVEKKGKEAGDPSFDELLKEAGVDQKKDVKPKLEKKSLSGDDFKNGMGSIAAKAQACYKGTQGTATIKLTVAPSGKVSKVSVGGAFAGKPEADCVAAAVKSASFPAWDGGPESFGYSYLLSE